MAKEGKGSREGLSRKERGFIDVDNSVVIGGSGSIRGLNGYEKYNN